MNLDEFSSLLQRSDMRIGLCCDSRQVTKGDCFIAIEGTRSDGHDYIEEAVKRGAQYIICQKPIEKSQAEVILVDNSAKVLGLLAQQRYGNPSRKLTNLAVTGTNGKTTVSYLVRSVIQAAGQKCGLVGTIVYDTGSDSAQANLTTPDALSIAKMADKMVQSSTKYMVIEASSHALSQNRLAGIDFAAAAFTNLTGDHLDYHKTKQQYLAAKAELFEKLSPQSTAVLNAQSKEALEIADKTKSHILWYAVDERADITAHIKSMDSGQTVYTLEYDGRSHQVETALLGLHNVSNHLAAAGLCIAAEFDFKDVAAGLSNLKSVPGRLESVDCGQDFAVLVDYAHTDDALKNVLKTLRSLCKGRLIALFGCGGDRDKTKRPRMAHVAEELADLVIVTSDNPRTENPEDIIKDISAGFSSSALKDIIIEADRKKAIDLAIQTAQNNDIVLIAGKGHETYQILGNKKIDFDDRIVAKESLQKILLSTKEKY